MTVNTLEQTEFISVLFQSSVKCEIEIKIVFSSSYISTVSTLDSRTSTII